MVRDMDEILTPVAEAQSIGLINASPLHRGILSSSEVPVWHPAPPKVIAAGRRA
jgi:L-galactose dehydrogenase